MILKKIPGEISKTITDIREGRQYRHLVKQKTIDDLKRIYATLESNETNVRDFQFIVREGDGAVIVVDPKSIQIDTPLSGAIRDTIREFEGYLRN